MIIKRITVRNFGSVQFYDTVLNSDLNILDTRFTTEISTAIELLLCSKSFRQNVCVNEATLITSEVLIDENLYFAEIKPNTANTKGLKITVKDVNGNDKTDFYQNTMSHCTEQDAIEDFDGQDTSLPMRLCWYKGCDDCDVPNDLYVRTNFVVGTKTFRSYLMRYIKAFKPEPINNKKNYIISINKQGKFEVMYSDVCGEINLSQTEEKLFRYICFLNIAEFWEDIENVRNIHHEKKPLLVKNFIDFLDESTDINSLIARTVQLGRQVIILALPMQETIKKKWMGEND